VVVVVVVVVVAGRQSGILTGIHASFLDAYPALKAHQALVRRTMDARGVATDSTVYTVRF
jgi:hypothetical protein